MDLTKKQKKTIRSEEMFKLEIGNSLKEEFKQRNLNNKFGVFSFLNQPFVIWILSALLFTLFPFLYSEYSKDKMRDVQIQKIDLELSYRLRSINISDSVFSPYIIYNKLLRFRLGPNLFEEFKERRSESLIYELYTLSDDSKKLELAKAFRATVFIPELADSLLLNELVSDSIYVTYDPNKLNIFQNMLIYEIFNPKYVTYWATPGGAVGKYKPPESISVIDYLSSFKDGVAAIDTVKIPYKTKLESALSDINIPRWRNIALGLD